MTRWQAQEELERRTGVWMDFPYWAYLQLEKRGEWSDVRMSEVLANHERAGNRREEYESETSLQTARMRRDGATDDEIRAYRDSRHVGQKALLDAWRSLEGLPPQEEENRAAIGFLRKKIDVLVRCIVRGGRPSRRSCRRKKKS